MPWPGQIDYQEALLFAARTLADPELASATPIDTTAFGMPRPITGQSANVYRLQSEDGRRWAIRLFLRDDPERATRYRVLAAHIDALAAPPDALVSFSYQTDGIRIGERVYPLLKMPWLDAAPLNAYVEQRLNDPDALDTLSRGWVSMIRALGGAQIAHGDLQHGNVLVEPESGALRLIDYDGLWTPALGAMVSGETGHPSFQHPGRLPNSPAAMVDRFAALCVYVALRVLRRAPELWYRLDNGDNLLFRREDFRDPAMSRGFALIRESIGADPQTRRLVEALADAARGPLTLIPPLDRFAPSENR